MKSPSYQVKCKSGIKCDRRLKKKRIKLRCVFNEHKGVDTQPLDIPSPGFPSHFKEEMGCASAEFLICSVLSYSVI